MLLGAFLAGGLTLQCFSKHRHKWQVRAIDLGVISEPRRNATAILYVCSSCGEAKSTTVAGTYQLEQIRLSHLVPDVQKANGVTNGGWSRSDVLFAKSLKVKL